MPADPTGILGYEPADPGYWGSCQLILPGYWGTSQLLRSAGPLIRRGRCSSRRVSDCVYKFSVYWLFGGELFLIFFFVAAVGIIAGVFCVTLV